MYVNGCLEPNKFKVHDAEIERVKSCDYLGSLVEADGDSKVPVPKKAPSPNKAQCPWFKN